MEEDYRYELSSSDSKNPDGVYPEEQKRRTIVLILIGLIFLFTLISVLCTFTIYKALLQREKDLIVEEKEATSDINDNSMNTGEDTGIENEEVDSSVQPELSDVKNIFEEIQSYRFKRTNIPESYIMEGEFQAPDNEFVVFKSEGLENQEIMVGDVIMSKEGEGKGEWKEIEEGFFIGNNSYFLSLLNVSSDIVSFDTGEKEFWNYYYLSNEKKIKFKVSRGSLLLNSIEILKDEQLIEQVEIFEHNSEEINVMFP